MIKSRGHRFNFHFHITTVHTRASVAEKCNLVPAKDGDALWLGR